MYKFVSLTLFMSIHNAEYSAIGQEEGKEEGWGRQACLSHCNLDSRIGRRQCCLKRGKTVDYRPSSSNDMEYAAMFNKTVAG